MNALEILRQHLSEGERQIADGQGLVLKTLDDIQKFFKKYDKR